MNQISENIGALELSNIPAYMHDAVLETSAGFADVGPSDSCRSTLIKGMNGCPRIDDGMLEASVSYTVSDPRPTSPRYACPRIDDEMLEASSLHASAGGPTSILPNRPRCGRYDAA